MVVLPEIGESPLPKVNSRFGHPTPQSGVEVERKWKRADYEMPKGENPFRLRQKETKANLWPNQFCSKGDALGAGGVFSTFGFDRKSMLGIFFEPKAKR
jgi:hypothetical protein